VILRASGLRWLSAVGTLLLALSFAWAVVNDPKPDTAALHPRMAGGPASVMPSPGSPQTYTYVS